MNIFYEGDALVAFVLLLGTLSSDRNMQNIPSDLCLEENTCISLSVRLTQRIVDIR